MNRQRRNVIRIAIAIVALVGLALLAYPHVAHWINDITQRGIIADYDRVVGERNASEASKAIADAEEYNAELARTGLTWKMSEEDLARYNSLLDVTGTGMMGYLQIPKIDVSLPIYHGTGDDVLSGAIGHLAGSSLPVGGVGTHCSVSGHRGLPTPRLLTDLGMLQTGDTFTITVLDRVLTYEVDQIRTVLPQNLGDLAIDPNEDYVTLVTCTPFGVNSHRLLVRGHRVNANGGGAVVADAVLVRPQSVAVFLAVLVLVVMLGAALLWRGRRARSLHGASASAHGANGDEGGNTKPQEGE